MWAMMLKFRICVPAAVTTCSGALDAAASGEGEESGEELGVAMDDMVESEKGRQKPTVGKSMNPAAPRHRDG